MVDAFDIAIRRARLRGRDGLAEIGIRDGGITAIADTLAGKATTEIDARGHLVTESFVNPHLHLMTRPEIEKLYDMITIEAARAMNVTQHGLFEGARANLVVLDQSDVVETLRYHAPPAWVISNGRVVDQARMKAMASPQH